jgi:hypothetical protein
MKNNSLKSLFAKFSSFFESTWSNINRTLANNRVKAVAKNPSNREHPWEETTVYEPYSEKKDKIHGRLPLGSRNTHLQIFNKLRR